MTETLEDAAMQRSALPLEGKIALVTGAGRGIGREVARKLGSAGARVVVNDLDDDVADQTVASICEVGGEAVTCAGSVTAAGFADRFVATAVDTYGGLDIVVNNAGYVWDNVIQKMSDEQWDAILEVHVKAPFQILRAAQPVISAKAKAEQREGREVFRKVVNISSLAGTSGNPGQTNYAAAKAGILGLTKSLAKEWGRYHVNVNAVAFGMIATRGMALAGEDARVTLDGRTVNVGISQDLLEASRTRIPLGRMGTPAEAAGAVYLLCLPESDYITGQTIVCAGGLEI